MYSEIEDDYAWTRWGRVHISLLDQPDIDADLNYTPATSHRHAASKYHPGIAWAPRYPFPIASKDGEAE